MRPHEAPEANFYIGIGLLTIREVLDNLRISRSTFYQLVKDGKIPLRKVGGASRVRSDELDAYIQNLPALGDTKVREGK